LDENLEHAIQVQQKFEFYFLALVFTVLGLSIQTSQFSSRLQSVFEVTAWISFLVSGLAGLSRMEWTPVFYARHSDLTNKKSFVKEAKTGRPVRSKQGKLLSDTEVEERVQQIENEIKEGTQEMDTIETKGKVKYFLHKWMFVVGLGLLIISRSINLYSSSTGSPVPVYRDFAKAGMVGNLEFFQSVC
jgi:hypothetical protein